MPFCMVDGIDRKFTFYFFFRWHDGARSNLLVIASSFKEKHCMLLWWMMMESTVGRTNVEWSKDYIRKCLEKLTVWWDCFLGFRFLWICSYKIWLFLLRIYRKTVFCIEFLKKQIFVTKTVRFLWTYNMMKECNLHGSEIEAKWKWVSDLMKVLVLSLHG